jgi:hypothetical protein
MPTAEIVEVPEITGKGRPYHELHNEAVTRAQFNDRYFSGLRARFKAELALGKPFERASEYEWKGVTSEALDPQEQADLKLYETTHRDFRNGKYVGEVYGNAVDFSKYAGAARALKDGWALVDIYTGSKLVKEGEEWKAKGGQVLECVPFAPSGHVLAIEKSGKLILYDNEDMAGFAPATHRYKSTAVKSQIPFYESMITGLDSGGTKIINPTEVSETHTSWQGSPGMGPGLLVALRFFWLGGHGPLVSYFRPPVNSHANVGGRSRRN